MVFIRIGDEERRYDPANAQWIAQQIARRRADGVTPCVQLTINTGDMNIALKTPAVHPAAVGGRIPTPQENVISDLWQQHGLNDPDFAPGNIIAFLQNMRRAFY
jgi:hypothetical protein